MSKSDKNESISLSGANTKIGQHIRFTCPESEVNIVKKAIEIIQEITYPQAVGINLSGRKPYSRYGLTRHGAGECPKGHGWAEVLTIDDPPDGRHNIVMYEKGICKGRGFSEWKTLDNAMQALEQYRDGFGLLEDMEKLPGFIRFVHSELTPWFYAVGHEYLIGDYAVPWNITDDPVFRMGAVCVVEDYDHTEHIKTCLGCRYIEEVYDHHTSQGRIIYWDDGTCWHDYFQGTKKQPRPIDENAEGWIVQAMQEFQKLLAGCKLNFEIPFIGGTKFVGKIIQQKDRLPCAEGKYLVVVYCKGKKPTKGWVFDFKPTPEDPDIISYITRKYGEVGREIEKVEILESQVERYGKKWAGVFHKRNPH